jgi:hypothetical protein
MTLRGCKKKLDKLIEEATNIRMSVLSFDNVDMFAKIESSRLEPFKKNVLELIKEITDDKEYIKFFANIGPYEYCMQDVQKKLVEIKNAILLMEKLKFED